MKRSWLKISLIVLTNIDNQIVNLRQAQADNGFETDCCPRSLWTKYYAVGMQT